MNKLIKWFSNTINIHIIIGYFFIVLMFIQIILIINLKKEIEIRNHTELKLQVLQESVIPSLNRTIDDLNYEIKEKIKHIDDLKSIINNE